MIHRIRKTFSSAHFYKQAAWTETRNQDEFGKCFSEFGHGHDYQWELEFESLQPDHVNQAMDLLVERLDHHHLNFQIPDFHTKIPTTENICLYLQKELGLILMQKNVDWTMVRMNLKENAKIWVEL